MKGIAVEVVRVTPGTPLWQELIAYALSSPWLPGPHLARMMEENAFHGWESAFAALDNGRIVGYCTLLETDYYPENRYFPWISSIFVDESARGRRISEQLVSTAEEYARQTGFSAAYIPSDITGLYEKYGYRKIDSLVNYGGDTDFVFEKKLL